MLGGLLGKKKKTPEEVDFTESELKDVDQEFRREVAITKARPVVISVLFWIWTILDVLILLAAILIIGFYLVNGSFVDRRLTARFAQNTQQQRASSVAQQAASLIIEDDPRTFSLGEGRYDFLSLVENPNEDWAAELKYRFVYSGGETEEERAMVAPGTTLPLAALGQTLEGAPGTVRLEITHIKWKRPNLLKIDSTVSGQSALEFTQERLNFVITNERHGLHQQTTPQTTEQEQQGALTPSSRAIETTATITNQTPYSYWDAVFYVVVERGGNPIGVNTVTIKGFETGESRDVVVRWFGDAPRDGEVVIYPAIDIFDKDVYMPRQADVEPERFF